MNVPKEKKTHYIGPKDKRLGGKHVYDNAKLRWDNGKNT